MDKQRKIAGYDAKWVDALEWVPMAILMVGMLALIALHEMGKPISPGAMILLLVAVGIIAAPLYIIRRRLISKHLDSLPDAPGDWYLEGTSSPTLYFWRLGESGEYVYLAYDSAPADPEGWRVSAGAETEDEVIEEETVESGIERESDALEIALTKMRGRDSPRPRVKDTYVTEPEEQGRSWIAVGMGIVLLVPSVFGLYFGISHALSPGQDELTREEFEANKEFTIEYMEAQPDRYNQSQIAEARNTTYEETINSEPQDPVLAFITGLPQWVMEVALILLASATTLASISIMYSGIAKDPISFRSYIKSW